VLVLLLLELVLVLVLVELEPGWADTPRTKGILTGAGPSWRGMMLTWLSWRVSEAFQSSLGANGSVACSR